MQILPAQIVSDEVGDARVAATFCPRCNTAIAYDRRLAGRVLDFGTTGNLPHCHLLMWDCQTESWRQQITGEGIVGELTGQRHTMLPAAIVAWADFRQQFPRGGYGRPTPASTAPTVATITPASIALTSHHSSSLTRSMVACCRWRGW